MIHPDKIVPSGWMDTEICEAILTKEVRLIAAVDGSPDSMTAFTYVTEGVMQVDRQTFVEVLHVFDPSKTYLPLSCQPDALRSTCEAIMASSVSSRRYRLTWVRKRPGGTGDSICAAIKELPADYICVGFLGLKGKKDTVDVLHGGKLCSNVFAVLTHGTGSSLICIKDETKEMLPIRQKKAVFVVSVGLNKVSTKAFLDALRLSKSGDELHVAYCRGYMESEDSDYTAQVRDKYEGFFKSMASSGSGGALASFHDRKVQFVFVEKQRREATPQALVRYADEVGADFLVVGANAADRVARGKRPIGSVSLQICLLTERNFIVANWVDVIPRVYQELVVHERQ